MLRWTSLLFATVVLHAYDARCVWYHHAFLLLTLTSVLFHCTHAPWVRIVDKSVAHATFFMVVVGDWDRAQSNGQQWLLAFPMLVACLWGAQSFCASVQLKTRMHAWLHVVSVVGLHAFLDRLYR